MGSEQKDPWIIGVEAPKPDAGKLTLDEAERLLAACELNSDAFMACDACLRENLANLCVSCRSNQKLIDYRDKAWDVLMVKYGIIIKRLDEAQKKLSEDRSRTATMGMNLRDWRAMLVFQSILVRQYARPDLVPSISECAAMSYEYADELEAASKK